MIYKIGLHDVYTTFPYLSLSLIYNNHSCQLMEKTYQVIIIGAGISGIASSNRFKKVGIEHIILESR